MSVKRPHKPKLVAAKRGVWCGFYVQYESEKFPLRFSDIFPKRLRIFNQFLHAYYTFLCTLDYKFLFNYNFQL